MTTLLSAISEMDTTYHLRIQPSKNSFGLGLWELWKFRELLMALVMRDIKLRYRQTALGVAWVILQPSRSGSFSSAMPNENFRTSFNTLIS
jgi:hypothetical protein